MDHVAGTKVHVNLDAFPVRPPETPISEERQYQLHPSVHAFARKKVIARVRWTAGLAPITDTEARRTNVSKPQPTPKVFGLGGEGGGDAEIDNYDDGPDKLYGKRWRIRGPRIIPEPLNVVLPKCSITHTAAHLSWVTHERNRCRELLKSAAQHLASADSSNTSLASSETIARSPNHLDIDKNQQPSSSTRPESITFQTHPAQEPLSRLTYLKQIQNATLSQNVQQASASHQTISTTMQLIPYDQKLAESDTSTQKRYLLSTGMTLSETAAAAAASVTRVRPKTAPRSHRAPSDTPINAQNGLHKFDGIEPLFKSSLFAATALMPDQSQSASSTSNRRPASAAPHLHPPTEQSLSAATQPFNLPSSSNDSSLPSLLTRRPSVVTLIVNENDGPSAGMDETGAHDHMTEVNAYVKASERANLHISETAYPPYEDQTIGENTTIFQQTISPLPKPNSDYARSHVPHVSAVSDAPTHGYRPKSAVAAAAQAKDNQGWFQSLMPRPLSATHGPANANFTAEVKSTPSPLPNRSPHNLQATKLRPSSSKASPSQSPSNPVLHARSIAARPSSAFPAGLSEKSKPISNTTSRARPNSSTFVTYDVSTGPVRRDSASSRDKKRVNWMDMEEKDTGRDDGGNDNDNDNTSEGNAEWGEEPVYGTCAPSKSSDQEDDDELDEWEAHFDTVAGVKPTKRLSEKAVKQTSPVTPTSQSNARSRVNRTGVNRHLSPSAGKDYSNILEQNLPPQTVRFLKSLQYPVDTSQIDVYAQETQPQLRTSSTQTLVSETLASETKARTRAARAFLRRGSVRELIGQDDEDGRTSIGLKLGSSDSESNAPSDASPNKLPRRASLLATASLVNSPLPRNAPAEVIASMVAANESAASMRTSHALTDWASAHDRVIADTVTALDAELSNLFGF